MKNLKRVRAAVSKLKNSSNGNVAAKTFGHGEERFSQLHASPSQSTTSTENARKLEPGRYIMTGINSGMTLDLRHDNRTLYGYQFHGKDNQQVRATITHLTLESGRAEWTLFLLSSVIMTVCPLLRAALHTTHMIVCRHFGLKWEFCPCGEGFVINSVYSSSSFVAVRDLTGLGLRREGGRKLSQGPSRRAGRWKSCQWDPRTRLAMYSPGT